MVDEPSEAPEPTTDNTAKNKTTPPSRTSHSNKKQNRKKQHHPLSQIKPDLRWSRASLAPNRKNIRIFSIYRFSDFVDFTHVTVMHVWRADL